MKFVFFLRNEKDRTVIFLTQLNEDRICETFKLSFRLDDWTTTNLKVSTKQLKNLPIRSQKLTDLKTLPSER